jgi:hypothetical protein
VAVTHLRSADHGAPIFHGDRDEPSQATTDDRAGEQTVEVILGAIDAAADSS